MRYVPWLSVLAFLVVVAGAISWAVGADIALGEVAATSKTLLFDVSDYTTRSHSVAVFAVVACAAMATAMFTMSVARACLRWRVDNRGEVVRRQCIWFATSGVLTFLWWVVLFLLNWSLFVSVVWYSAMWGANGILGVAVQGAEYALAAGISIQANGTSAGDDSSVDWGALGIDVGDSALPPVLPPGPAAPPAPADSSNADSCDFDRCLNLAFLDFYLGRRICICSTQTLRTAQGHAHRAMSASAAVVAGAVLLWAGASFLLMLSAADFAQARREHVMLTRSASQLSSAVAGGGGSSSDALEMAQQGGGAGAAPGIVVDAYTVPPTQHAAQQQPYNPFGQLAAGGGGGVYSGGYKDYVGAPEADEAPLLLHQQPAPHVGPAQLQRADLYATQLVAATGSAQAGIGGSKGYSEGYA